MKNLHKVIKDYFYFFGAFLVTYTIAMITCGIPLFFQEVAVGQYLGTGGMTLVGQLCPILQGKFKNECFTSIYKVRQRNLVI